MPDLEEMAAAMLAEPEVFTSEEFETLDMDDIFNEVVFIKASIKSEHKDNFINAYHHHTFEVAFPRRWKKEERNKITFELTFGFPLALPSQHLEWVLIHFLDYASDGENLTMNNLWQAGADEEGNVNPEKLLECAAHEISTTWGAIDHDNDPPDKAFKMARYCLDSYHAALRLFGETVYSRLIELFEESKN
jgi:hypothetical protein